MITREWLRWLSFCAYLDKKFSVDSQLHGNFWVYDFRLAAHLKQRLLTIWGTANIGLNSSVGKNAWTSNQRSWAQTPVQSSFLCSSEIEVANTWGLQQWLNLLNLQCSQTGLMNCACWFPLTVVMHGTQSHPTRSKTSRLLSNRNAEERAVFLNLTWGLRTSWNSQTTWGKDRPLHWTAACTARYSVNCPTNALVFGLSYVSYTDIIIIQVRKLHVSWIQGVWHRYASPNSIP